MLPTVKSTCWDSSRLKIIRQGKAKSGILSHNCPAWRTSETVSNDATLAKLVSIATVIATKNWAEHVKTPQGQAHG